MLNSHECSEISIHMWPYLHFKNYFKYLFVNF